MLKSLLFLTMFVSSSAWAGSVGDGGMSGGGGGTLPADPVDRTSVLDAIRNSKVNILTLLHDRETDMVLHTKDASGGLYNRTFYLFFQHQPDVYEILRNVQFILPETPCLDFDHKEKDGSIATGLPNTICLSVGNLTKKLSFSNYQGEITGLILHELSHLAGANEEQAVEIQHNAVRFLSHSWNTDSQQWARDMSGRVREATYDGHFVYSDLKDGSRVSCRQIEKIENEIENVVFNLMDGGKALELTREIDTEKYWNLLFKFKAVTLYLCAQPGIGGSDVERRVDAESYARGFGTDELVTAPEFFHRLVKDTDPFDRYPLVKLPLKKFSGKEDATKVFAEIMDKLKPLEYEMDVLSRETFQVP